MHQKTFWRSCSLGRCARLLPVQPPLPRSNVVPARPSAVLVTTWAEDGGFARIEDPENELVAMLRLAEWFESGERVGQPAWVVEWLPPGGRMTARALVALTGDLPAGDEARHRLCEKAVEVARSGPPDEPRPFGHAPTGMACGDELVNRIELISHALQAAEGRLHQAAPINEDWGGDLVAIALTECLAWLRALDEVMVQLWQQFLPEQVREDVSRRVDAFLERPNVSAGFMDEQREERQRTGSAYRDWTIALLVEGTALPRQELAGLRWLAGKMLHFGPLPATELRHWRAGEEPR